MLLYYLHKLNNKTGLYLCRSLPTPTAFVCLYTWYLKTDAARITKLDVQVFHDES